MTHEERKERLLRSAMAAIDLAMEAAKELRNIDALPCLIEAKAYLARLPGFAEGQ